VYRPVEEATGLGANIAVKISDHVDAYLGTGIDIVITVCDRAAANCPTFPERTDKVRWRFDTDFHGRD